MDACCGRRPGVRGRWHAWRGSSQRTGARSATAAPQAVPTPTGAPPVASVLVAGKRGAGRHTFRRLHRGCARGASCQRPESLRGPAGGSFGVEAGAVPADDADPGSLGQPGRQGVRFPVPLDVGQQRRRGELGVPSRPSTGPSPAAEAARGVGYRGGAGRRGLRGRRAGPRVVPGARSRRGVARRHHAPHRCLDRPPEAAPGRARPRPVGRARRPRSGLAQQGEADARVLVCADSVPPPRPMTLR